MALPTPSFQTSSFQYCEVIHSCCFRPPSLWNSLPTIPTGGCRHPQIQPVKNIQAVKIQESSEKQELNLLCTGSCLCSIYTVFGNIRNLEMTESIWEDACRLCSNTMLLYIRDWSVHRLWCLQRVLGPLSRGYQGMTVFTAALRDKYSKDP